MLFSDFQFYSDSVSQCFKGCTDFIHKQKDIQYTICFIAAKIQITTERIKNKKQTIRKWQTKDIPYWMSSMTNTVSSARNGCVSVAFRMYNPECYSLHRTDLEERNARLYQAFKHLPSGSFVHKQDVFLKREYVHELERDSFIDKAEQRHFSGGEYLEHDCLLIFTLSGLSSLAASYNANPFSYRERLHVSDREKLTEFLEGVNSAIGVINSIRDTRLERMAAASLREYVIRYINSSPGLTATVTSISPERSPSTGKSALLYRL